VKNKKYRMRFLVLAGASAKMAVFGDVASCCVIALVTEAVNTSETSVIIY
jgi:hypothetical protein